MLEDTQGPKQVTVQHGKPKAKTDLAEGLTHGSLLHNGG